MNETNENEIYIPEYNPNKYKKAIKVVKIISIIFLCIMFVGIALLMMKFFLDKNAFIVNVNDVPQKDWSFFLIILGMIVSVFGLGSLFTWVLYMRLKQANAVFAEKDEQKRLEGHLTFDKQAKTAAKIAGSYAASQLAKDIKDLTNKNNSI